MFKLQNICHTEWLKSKHTSIIRIATENRDESFPTLSSAVNSSSTTTVFRCALHINLHKLCVVFILFNKMITYIIITSHILMRYMRGCCCCYLRGSLTLLFVSFISFSFPFIYNFQIISNQPRARTLPAHFHLIWFQDRFILFEISSALSHSLHVLCASRRN